MLHAFLQTHTSPLMCKCCFVACVTTVNCLYHVTECNYCCLLSIHTGMNKGGTVQCNTQDLSTKAHMGEKKDILHYCVCSSVLIAMEYPHSFWCSAGHFTPFSCGLCHTEAQSVQIFVLIKPPHCSVQPGMCS